MKKSAFTFFVTLLLSSCLSAQQAISFGPQIGLASNFSSSAKMGIGGSVEYDNRIGEHFGIRGSAGYTYFKGKYFDDHVSFIPVRAGVQGYLAPEVFIAGEAGVAIYGDSNKESKTGFSIGLGAGYRIPLSSTQFVQLSGSYNYFKHSSFLNYTWFNFRAAFGLSWGKTKSSLEK
jgi:opacity protein-like surface antigen